VYYKEYGMPDLKDWPDDFDWEELAQRIKKVLEKHGTKILEEINQKVFEEMYQQDWTVSGEIDWELQEELNKK
jgi:predicted component of type VI protein secretion system